MKRTGWFVIIPLIFIAIGGMFLFFSISRLSNQSTANGVIVDIDRSTDSDGDTSYRPVIEFRADDGVAYTFTGRIGSSRRPTIGNSIEVLYDPADPQGATEKTFSNLWLFPIAFGGFGLVFLILMAFTRARFSSGFRNRNMSTEEAAAALDKVLDRIPDIGPSGPADSGPLQEDTFTQRPLEVDLETPTQGHSPVGGTAAEFRRAEASIGPDGTMKYRVVAKDDAGNEYYSDLLDEDPTVVIMQAGNEVQLVERRNGWVVDFEMPDDD
ncbi:MAG: DUF3592 domain-containing protein [Acidimicrobiia bacterium]|nr:DUF3592 domain-containing protein [Acidimicrobiia bacterium]